MKDRSLEVRLLGAPAGALSLKENGNMQFRYAEGYGGPAISIALPVRAEAYPHRACEAWFGGLLPEGDVRDALARALGTSSANQFRILNEIGGDCAGAVEIVPETVAPLIDRDPELLSPEALDEVIASLPQRPLGADPEHGIRMSLAGAQSKLPVIVDADAFALPKSSGAPTTHLIKPEPDRFEDLVANEFFCMTLAHACGLDVAETDARETVGGQRFLLVRRYDRAIHDDGTRARLHQEDFCQALLIRSENKYQQDGGPSLRQLSDLIRRESRSPAADVFKLWDAAVFNWAIGNCDAHAKNFSLLYDGRAPRLAPLYDLVSTMIYPELSRRWAMTLGGARSYEDVSAATWEALPGEMSIGPRAAIERARQLLMEIKALAANLLTVERFANENAPQEIAARIERLVI